MNDKAGIHCYVQGKVQGVWFRASTKEEAKALGITGWAKNLADGRVEVLAFGGKKELQQLYAWLQQGPPLAKVNAVSYEELAWQEYADFSIS